jgi:hypothetical protein
VPPLAHQPTNFSTQSVTHSGAKQQFGSIVAGAPLF